VQGDVINPLDSKGEIKKSVVLPHSELIKHPSWNFAKNIVEKKYFEF